MLKFRPHPHPNFRGAFIAFDRARRYSFLVMTDPDGTWMASYADHKPKKGRFSASSTMRGPFASLDAAKQDCEERLKQLRKGVV